MVGCSPQASTKKLTSKTKTKPTNPTIKFENVQVTKNDGYELDLTATAVNITNKAIYIQSSDFALSNDSTSLSPSSNQSFLRKSLRILRQILHLILLSKVGYLEQLIQSQDFSRKVINQNNSNLWEE